MKSLDAVRLLFVLSLSLLSATSCGLSKAADTVSTVTPTILPPGDPVSPTYTVSVNGVDVPVWNSRDSSYARFAFTGTATITITVKGASSSYRLSPLAANLGATISGSTLRLTLTKPRKLIVHPANQRGERLCLSAEAPEDSPVVPGTSGVTTLSGVDTSGTRDVTSALQAAINKLPAGGTLYIPRGIYAFSDLDLKANTTVYLAAGAALKALGANNYNSQINFSGADGAVLRGRGVIDGDGYRLRTAVNGNEQGRTLISNDSGTTTKDVVIEGVTIRNPPVWTAIIFDTYNWSLRNLAIISDDAYANRDGIDPHNAQRMIIDDCVFLTSDDCVGYSTTQDNLDLGTTIKNCVMFNSNSGACVRFGPWIGANTRNVTIENLDLVQSCQKSANEAALPIYAGGTISDIRYRNLRVESLSQNLIYMITQWNDYYAGQKKGSIKNVTFEGLICLAPGWVSLNAPSSSATIQGVFFSDFKYLSRAVGKPADFQYDSEGSVSNVTFTSTPTPVVTLNTTSTTASSSSPATIVVAISTVQSKPISVPLIVRGNAVAGTDYQVLPTTVTIPPGKTLVTFPLTPLAAQSGTPRVVVVEANHSDSRTYMLGPNYRTMVTLTGATTLLRQ
ncbi:MAG: glycosyl hydrolase family 28 protein [Planctomycetaceae bacterium]